ncbi:MAG: phosphoribosylformylglycinamidine cyclo-ligase [Nitrosopumilus sp.]|nr:phosphoribosylformylglycinamidine cyclo-ligase [Nitrosopumilus sp.]
MGLTYGGSGVDVAALERSRRAIGRAISSTHGLGPARTVDGFGHYAGLVSLPGGRMLATHTDGVGTKVLVARMMEKYDTVGIDCIAMNVNDVICVGAEPVSFVDYIAASRNEPRIFASIARGLARGARQACVPIVGGETAVMPGLMGGRGFSFDLAGTVAGIVGRGRLVTGSGIREGDVITGAASSGLHSNGYSLARRALLRRYSVRDRVRGVGTIGGALLRPTRIYAGPVLEIAKRCRVSGLAHITGGSFAKLGRLKAMMYEIDHLPRIPPIMGLIEGQGVARREMYSTFNMGVGFCVIAPPSESGTIAEIFKRHGVASQEVGRVRRGRGVSVMSERIA